MSCLLVIGFFPIVQGKRVTIQRNGPKPKSLPYIVYNTAINFRSDGVVPMGVELCIYGSQSTPILPDNTVVYVIAKAYLPPNAVGILEPLLCLPFPGDPSDPETYDFQIPDCPFPFIIGLRNTASHASSAIFNNCKVFDMAIGEYVTGETRSLPIICTLNAESPRWVNTPVPSANSCTMIMGPADSRFTDGRLHVDLDNLVLNVGSHSAYQSNTTSLDASSPKKQRFNAFGSPLPSTMSVPSTVAGSPGVASTSSIQLSSSFPNQEIALSLGSTPSPPIDDAPSLLLPSTTDVQNTEPMSCMAECLHGNNVNTQTVVKPKQGRKSKQKEIEPFSETMPESGA